MTSSAKVQDIALEDEDIVVAKSNNAADAKFDQIIGCIEDIIIDDKFQQMQDDFMERNYKHFEDSDENKLIYTTVHREYTNLIEKYLETQLKKKIENFSMEEFMSDLMSRKSELEGEIFEILLTFEDFLEFKQLMLNYKSSKEGKSLDLSMGLVIQSINFDNKKSNLIISSSENANSSSKGKSSTSSTNNSNTNRRNLNNTSNKTNTPLLDNIQAEHIESDHE